MREEDTQTDDVEVGAKYLTVDAPPEDVLLPHQAPTHARSHGVSEVGGSHRRRHSGAGSDDSASVDSFGIVNTRERYNASFIIQNAGRMRSRSQTLLHSRIDRTKTKVMTLGALSRHARELKAAYGDEFSGPKKRSWRDNPNANRCLYVVNVLCCCCRRCCRRWKPIEADGPLRRRWDAVQVMLLLYVAVVVPLRTGFDDTGIMVSPFTAMWWFELAVDAYFSKCHCAAHNSCR